MTAANGTGNDLQLRVVVTSLAIFWLSFVARGHATANGGELKAQPEALHFGTVRQGAIVEGSIRLLMPGDSAAGLAVRAEPPPFVTLRDVNVGTQTYGTLGTKIYCDVIMDVDTRQIGNLAGLLRVWLGEEQLSLRITSTVTARESDMTRILVAETPFERFSTQDARIFEAWKAIVEDGKLDPSYLEVKFGLPVLRDIKLADFAVVFLSGSGIVRVQEEDIEKLQRFVERGGRVVVAASAFMVRSVPQSNKLIERFGIKMRDVERPGGGHVELDANGIQADILTAAVQSVRIHRATPVAVIDRDKAKILIHDEQGDGYVAVARVGQGEVIALGVPLWWKWISPADAATSDNARLLQNLLTRPAAKDVSGATPPHAGQP